MSESHDVNETDASAGLYHVLAACLKRLESGEQISVTHLAAEYPEWQTEVRQFLADYAGFRDLISPLQPDTDAVEADDCVHPLGRFGDYELTEILGRGGMAVVYKARQLRLDRVVALKMVELPLPAAARRFRLEAQLVATLDHPHIVPVYDVGECEGRLFYTMRFFDAGSLADALARGSWRAEEGHGRSAEVTATVARAVQFAHDHGIFHRDLKPANILLDGARQPHVADFGLARRATIEPGSTQTGAILGTPAYMPPEQAMGRQSGFATADVYALGAILYELLTGRPVHAAASPIETILRVIECDPVRPRSADPSIPRDLETICLKCLDREPGKRYQSAAALADDLARWQRGEPIFARPVRGVERAVRWARRHPTAVRVAGAAVTVAVAALWIGSITLERERTASAEARLRSEAEARERIEQQHYFRAIILAARERSSGNPGRAEQLLAQCPPSLRGWEWHYLRRQLLGVPEVRLASSHLFALAISPNARFLAAGGSDGSIEIWDLARGMSHRFAAHAGEQVRGLAFSSDASRLASTGWDGKVVLWDVETRNRLQEWEFRDPADRPRPGFSVAFSPDGRILVAAVGREIRCWDLTTGTALAPILGHDDVIRRVAFAPNGREFAAVDDSGRLKVWVPGRPEPRLDIQAHPHLIFDLAYSADGTRLVTAGGLFYMHGDLGEVKVWEATDGSLAREFTTKAGAFYAAAFTPDGSRIMAGGEDGRVRVWDAATGDEALVLQGHVEAIWGLVFTADGKRLYTAGGDHRVRLWDATPLADPALPATPRPGLHELRVTSAAFSPRGDVLVSASMDGATLVRNPNTGEVIRSLPSLRGQIHALAFNPEGTRLASAVWRRRDDPHPDAGIVVRDTKTWDIVAGPTLDTYGVLSTAYSPDGGLLVAADDHGITMFDTATWKSVWHERQPRLVTAVAFGLNEVACADANGGVTFRDPRTGAVLPGPIAAHSGRVGGLAYSHDRALLASAGLDGAVCVWEVASRTQVAAEAGHVGGAYAVVFTPKGDHIYSGGNDGVVRVWDARNGRAIRAIAGHTDAVHALAIHPTGASFASGSRDRSVRLWDIPPEADLTRLR